jgi:ABC-type glycerol-3-phosphate transport system permease component
MSAKNLQMSPWWNRWVRLIIYSTLIIWALINFLPIAWVALAGFKTDVEIFKQPFALPQQWSFENYKLAFEKAHIGPYFINSVVFAGGTTVVGLILASLCAFPFAVSIFVSKVCCGHFSWRCFCYRGRCASSPSSRS